MHDVKEFLNNYLHVFYRLVAYSGLFLGGIFPFGAVVIYLIDKEGIGLSGIPTLTVFSWFIIYLFVVAAVTGLCAVFLQINESLKKLTNLVEQIDEKLSCGLSSEAKLEAPVSYDKAEDINDFDEDTQRESTEVVIDVEDEAGQMPGATLASVREQFDESRTFVRNQQVKFSEHAEKSVQSEERKPNIESKAIQSWLEKSVVEGTIDSDGDLYVSLETSSEEITHVPTKFFITGTDKLASGSKSETSEISDQITTNEKNWLQSNLKGVGRENVQFSYNLNCEVYGCAERVVVPLKLNKGKVSDCPITAGQIGISELKFVFEDGDFRAEGTITGPNGFIYAAEVLTEEPEEGHVPWVNKTSDDENSVEIYESLWEAKKGDTVFVVLCAFEKLDEKLSLGFTGQAQIEEPNSYDYGEPSMEASEAVTDRNTLNFTELGDEPYNWYFNMVRKFSDYDLAEEKFSECVDEFLENNGHEGVHWKELSKRQIGALLEHVESIETFNDAAFDETVNGPLHTYIHNALFDAAESDGLEQSSDISKSSNKNIFDITNQPIGSMEFKIEVASACAESEMNYKDFAEMYNLHADELNSWAVEYLGESFSSTQNETKGNTITFGVNLWNVDSGHTHDLELIFDNTENFDASKLTANKTEMQWKEVFYELFDNPDFGETKSEGLFYSDAANQLTRIAFDKLGWHDVNACFNYIKIGNKDAKLTDQDLDIISDYLRIQLNRDDYSMYFYG